MVIDDTRFAFEALKFTEAVDNIGTPDQVLDALNSITSQHCRLNVLGGFLLPVRRGDLTALELPNTAHLHKSAPKGWWQEWCALSKTAPGVGAIMMASVALAPITLTEAMQRLGSLGIDRWPYELALKYGIRDQVACPVGGRWIIVYWSRTALAQRLTQSRRALLLLGATTAAIRLQKIAVPSSKRLGQETNLTTRELAVLRLVSNGKRVQETAQLLALGEETVRSHLKKAESKLRVHDRAHAVAKALRLQLIS
jgi:DNA-binding CsgD family transcriptional regulator